MSQISVVIPLYNKENSIGRTIKSVLSQTYQDFELIIVDDGSRDKSAEIVRSFTDKRIRLIQQENAGVSVARNTGIEASKAEIIAFLDADDEWLPVFLETIIRLRKKYPDAGLYGTAYEVHYPGSIVQKTYIANEGERILPSNFGAFVEFGGPIFNSSSFAAPKEVLEEIGGYPLRVKWSEDTMVWGKIALQFPIAYSPCVCSIYHQYSENNSTGIPEYLENPFLKYISTIEKDELLKLNNEQDFVMYCDLCRIATIRRNIYSGYCVKARQELSKVTSTPYIQKKRQLLLMSYLPRYIVNNVHKHAKVLSYLK
ncbi:glycosyltransferase family A protein [Methanolobus sp.]|uniref:glycosyltransferase family 2 protein n=1 Tax=Methanolobus sp. TaxID=1874737 RepID=UPI0025D5AD64|nr:glycosyltransferase family A protein [Methanolobus sp.]